MEENVVDAFKTLLAVHVMSAPTNIRTGFLISALRVFSRAGIGASASAGSKKYRQRRLIMDIASLQTYRYYSINFLTYAQAAATNARPRPKVEAPTR